MYASDTRPTDRQLWRPPIAVLEVGVLSAQGLTPMKTADGRVLLMEAADTDGNGTLDCDEFVTMSLHLKR